MVLTRHDLVETAANDPAGAARVLEAQFAARAEPDGALALAELSYQAGLMRAVTAPREALGLVSRRRRARAGWRWPTRPARARTWPSRSTTAPWHG